MDSTVLLKSTSLDEALAASDQGLAAWKEEDDLKVRLAVGYQLVEMVAKIDTDRASKFCEEVQQLHFQPGAALAAGSLGAIFVHVIELAIRALSSKQFSEDEPRVHQLINLIERIPSRIMRAWLYAKLAASAYRVGFEQYGHNIVRSNVILEIQRMTVESDQSQAVLLTLPVIYAYDSAMAEQLAAKLGTRRESDAWYSVVMWSLSHGFLGDQNVDPDKIRVKSDYPQLQKAVQAATHIRTDHLLFFAVTAISNVIEVSLDSMLDAIQALDILQRLDHYVADTLPDMSNIKHEGYLISVQAAIHRVRSGICRATGFKRGLSSKDIYHRWLEIANRAQNKIPNRADRVLVMSDYAQKLGQYNRKDRTQAADILQKAADQVLDIPTLPDRVDRLCTIAKAWATLEERPQAELALETAASIAKQLETIPKEQRLNLIVQAAFTVSDDFADQIASRLDTRSDSGLSEEQIPSPINIERDAERLRKNPTKLRVLTSRGKARGTILALGAQRLLNDLVAGKGAVPHTDVLHEWLADGSYEPQVNLDISEWVIECLQRKGVTPSASTSEKLDLDVFLDTAKLIYELAKWLSPGVREGIPESVQDNFPGLSSRYEVFAAGEVERAKRWLQGWLREHVRSYVKICDPYFGLSELEYLRYVPLDCKVLIVTTDNKLSLTDGTEGLKKEILFEWSRISSQQLPPTQLTVVPTKFGDLFHDRVIVTSGTGLDLGQSLNGLGRSRGKIAILPSEDSIELEKSYVGGMLDQARWFMEQGLTPIVVMIGGES